MVCRARRRTSEVLRPLGLGNGSTTIRDNLDHVLKRGVMQVQIPAKVTQSPILNLYLAVIDCDPVSN